MKKTMKNIVYLLAMLCVASVGVAQSYDYDRIVQPTTESPQPWVEVALYEQTVSFPPGMTYNCMTLLDNTNSIDIEDMTIKFDHNDTQVIVTPILKDGADVEFRANNPVQFFVERGIGEKILPTNGEKEFTVYSLIKMVWTDPQGAVHKQHIGMIY